MKKIGIIGDPGAFAPRFKKLSIETQNFTWKELLDGNIKGVEAVFCFPDAGELNAWREPSLEEGEAILNLAESGVGIYTECMLTYGWRMRDAMGTQRFFEPRTAWRERMVVVNNEGPVEDFAKGDILDCRNATYGVGRSHQSSLLAVGTTSGTYRTSDAESEGASQNSSLWHVVYKMRDDRRQICANIDIRNAERKGFLPRQKWNALLDRIILYVLRPESASELKTSAASIEERWTPSPIPASQKENAYKQAVRSNIDWIRKNGLLPEADGSKGIFEGFDTAGHMMWEYRAECQFESALMFHHAGELLDDDELKKIADNIVTFALESGIQITDEKAEDYGLWHFYKQFREDSNYMYIDTAARAATGLLHFYKLNGRKECLERAEITLRALLKLRNHNGVLPDCIHRSDIKKCGMHGVTEEITILKDRRHGTPHHHSSVVSAFVMGYKATGNADYLDAAATVQKRLTAGFPDKFEDHFVYKFTIGRYILGLASLTHTPLKDDFLPAIKEALEYIMPLQHQTGAFITGPFGDLSGKTFETGIMCSDDDEITDNLYMNNYLTVAFQTLLNTVETDLTQNVVDKLLDFMSVSQPLSRQPGQYPGCWTRAFNLRTGDPFAFNGDIGWGAYCALTGWSNAVISLGFLMRLGGYEIIL